MKNFKAQEKPVFVTQPLLPPLAEFLPYLEQIWDNKQLTNNGPFHQQLEAELAKYLGVKYISLFTNGTIALVTALQALRITGEVITTPYSFVATAHSLLWNGIKPVFVDIEPNSMNMNPCKIEAAITPQTTAILPVHCYGHPCDVDRIEQIADNYGLKVIYDAAHAFGVRNQEGSILNHGDLSVLSFHATKVFNTFEGGAIVCHSEKDKRRIDHLKNFGFVDDATVVSLGINGKMSEVNAAFGLLQLKGIDLALAKRKSISDRYREAFKNLKGLRYLEDVAGEVPNFAYFPVLLEDAYPIDRDTLFARLKQHNIFARRYFYPLITEFPMYRGLPSAEYGNLTIARQLASKVLCLPIFPALTDDALELIIHLVNNAGEL